MPVETDAPAYTPIRAPRGTSLSCKGWQQEAAMRMLMNNLDEEVGERPQDLVVYGGTGKAARNWDCYRAIVSSLKALENDESFWGSRAKRVGWLKRTITLPPVLSRTQIFSGIWRNGKKSTHSKPAALMWKDR